MSITTRIDAVTALPPDRRAPVISAPRAVKIELTSRCNLACAFCAHGSRKDAGAGMDRALYRRLVHELVAAGVEEIGLFYVGESFLCPWLPEAIADAKAAGARYVFLTSNGIAATPARVEACFRAGLDSLKWSYNAASAEQFAAMSGRPAALWSRLNDHLAVAADLRDRIGASTMLSASSIHYDDAHAAAMAETLDRYVRPFVDEHYWLPLYSFGGLATDREASLGMQPSAGNRGRLGALRDPLPCWAVFQEAHITAAGRLSACCFDPGDRWVMGDLTRQSFLEAWNSEAFQALRAAHLGGDVHGTACEACAVGGHA